MGSITLDTNTPTLIINGDVYGVNDLFVSSYLVSTGEGTSGQKEYIAFDSGNDPENLRASLESYKISPEQVRAVFLTHAHGDHTSGLGVYTKSLVYISRAEKEYVTLHKSNEIDLSPEDVSKFESLLPGQKISINDATIEVIATPGHTPGSVSYLVNGKYVFAGATLNFDPNQKAEHQMYTLNDDHELLKKSNRELVRHIIDKKIEMVFTTHGGYTASPAFAFSEWIL